MIKMANDATRYCLMIFNRPMRHKVTRVW